MPIDCGGYAGADDDNAKAADRAALVSRLSESRKAATIRIARDLYSAMPGAPTFPTGPNGEVQWGVIEVTQHWNFCMRIASAIVTADSRTFM